MNVNGIEKTSSKKENKYKTKQNNITAQKQKHRKICRKKSEMKKKRKIKRICRWSDWEQYDGK